MPVRTLMISYEFPPLGGGMGVACHQVIDELSRCEDLGIDLVTSGPGPTLEREQYSQQVAIHKLPVPSKRCPQYWRAGELLQWTWQALHYADRLARERRYDLCHCWGGWPSGLVGYRLLSR